MEKGSTSGVVRGNRYYWTSATIKSPRNRQQEVGIVLDGRGRKRRHISTAEDVP
jgi:hypothetical protein